MFPREHKKRKHRKRDVMSPQDAFYFARRAQEENRKAAAARLRGEDQSAVAVHAELAVRYQAKALMLQRQ